jgi:hypothetical protein
MECRQETIWKQGDCGKKPRSLLFTVLNWRFSDATREMGEEVRHIEVILRGLQMMVIEESLSKYRNEWTLVERVFRMVGRLYRGQELSLLRCQQS